MTGQLTGLERQVGANPSSPLFARLADTLLKNGEISRALDVCERGMDAHPDYSTGRLVYARSLAARDRFEEAVRTLSPLLEAYPGNIVLSQLKEEWSGFLTMPDVQSTITTGSAPRAAFIEQEPVGTAPPEIAPETGTAAAPGTETTPETEPVVEPGATPETEAATAHPSSPDETPVTALPDPDPVELPGEVRTVPDDAVMMLGGESHAAPLMQSATGFVERDRIISRTLAEIYASQGATREAVETYRLLLERIPRKREEYEPRLKELEERLRLQPEGQKQPRE